MKKILINLIIVAMCCVALAAAVFPHCPTVTLKWDAPAGGTPSGYCVYVGTNSGVYQIRYDVGLSPVFTVTNLAGGATYYFAATAYGTNGVESGFSNEVIVSNLPTALVGSPVNVRVFIGL